MKYVSDYREARTVDRVMRAIRNAVSQPWTLMEICGGQTHAIVRYGLDQLLPPEIELVHGPGCPVCVTPLELIDRALAIASRPEVIFCSYGDMLRVPGTGRDLFSVKAAGGDVRVVYSPLDAVDIARLNPEKQIVFFAIGFETTAPANVMSVLQAQRLRLKNYSILVSHVRVPPAMNAILSDPSCRVQAFLLAGHVCTVMGYHEYEQILAKFRIPMVVTGFEPLDLANGIMQTVLLLEAGRAEIVNAYSRAVQRAGNIQAQGMITQVFEECDRKWRGIGTIPLSGWRLKPEFDGFNAEVRFQVQDIEAHESPICIAGQVLQGLKKPHDCPAFGRECVPENPLGATMVSSEGACAAYYRYARVTIRK